MRRSRVLAGIVTLLVAVGVGAQQEIRAKDRMLHRFDEDRLAEQWNRTLQQLVQLLSEADAKKARKARKIASDMEYDLLDKVIQGEGGCKFMGFALFFRAVAEGRLGDEEAAAWHWQMAQNVLPELRSYSFSNYPDVEKLLEGARIAEERWEHLAKVVAGEEEERGPEPGVEAPVATVRFPPKYPEGARMGRLQGPTHVEVVLDLSGVPHEPVVTRGCGSMGLDVAAMEALREWRYTPATRDGRPVLTFLAVTFHYVLK